jgi:ABC-type transporter Mla maintaining outer membrane lipid asymmetry ATPase subunit MlaF
LSKKTSFCTEFSCGIKRRVALASALVTDPEVVSLDEPIAGPDPVRRNAVYAIIVDFQKKVGFIAVMISHEVPSIFFLSRRIAMVDKGKIRLEATLRGNSALHGLDGSDVYLAVGKVTGPRTSSSDVVEKKELYILI